MFSAPQTIVLLYVEQINFYNQDWQKNNRYFFGHYPLKTVLLFETRPPCLLYKKKCYAFRETDWDNLMTKTN